MVALARNESARRIGSPPGYRRADRRVDRRVEWYRCLKLDIDVIYIYYESMYTSTHREYWEYNICMYACMYACIMYVCMYVRYSAR